MKREDYFNLMDCVSEEDITEMMQYCRSGQFSDREEEIVMTKQNHAESESKRGKGIAAAVAAVLVCANVAGGDAHNEKMLKQYKEHIFYMGH